MNFLNNCVPKTIKFNYKNKLKYNIILNFKNKFKKTNKQKMRKYKFIFLKQ